MNILLIRHGEIPSNVKKIYAGGSSEGLTDRGINQARNVAKQLRGYNISFIYSSPVYRAVQTTKIISDLLNIDFQIEPAFREMELGPWEGISEEEIARLYPKEWHAWQTRPADLRLNKRETLDELLGRVIKGIQNIYVQQNNSTVAIVSHVAIIRVLLLWQANKSLNLYKKIDVPNAKVFEIRSLLF